MNASADNATQVTARAQLWPWRVLYWEPVSGTGERLMVGVLHGFGGDYRSVRTIRDDVLHCLFGKSAAGLKSLIDHSLDLFQVGANAAQSLASIDGEIAGLHAGPLRETAARTASELLQTACLLYSSLANLDRLDDAEESDAPQQDEANAYFGTEVKRAVLALRPDLAPGFGRAAQLIPHGQPVRFGYFSPHAVLHFTVLHPVRWSTSAKDARARIWELLRAREHGRIENAALVAAVHRDDDATLGSRQRGRARQTSSDIQGEAESKGIRFFPVTSPSAGAAAVIEVVA